MARRRARGPRHWQKRVFRCPVCGAYAPALKCKAHTKAGHEKDMYCYVCRDITKHVQVE